ncbi:MAG: hypothetical protein ACI81V_001295 [Lentimonas sp.]|jgi:hypothetical protein
MLRGLWMIGVTSDATGGRWLGCAVSVVAKAARPFIPADLTEGGFAVG